MIDTQESITAKLCSFARAYHSNYGKEKIFDDYLAYDMMGKEEYEKTGQLIEQTIETISRISVFGNKVVFDFPDETTFTEDSVERVRRLSEITASMGIMTSRESETTLSPTQWICRWWTMW